MANINEILARAAALRDETALNSISPERAGGIMYDTLLALNELWLQQGAALVISKIYASVAAMEADTAPVSDLTGKPLRPGQIVVIASSDLDNGSVYRYNGTESPSWSLVGSIGNLDPVDSLDSDSTTLPLAAHQGKVLDGKISQLGQELTETAYSELTPASTIDGNYLSNFGNLSSSSFYSVKLVDVSSLQGKTVRIVGTRVGLTSAYPGYGFYNSTSLSSSTLVEIGAKKVNETFDVILTVPSSATVLALVQEYSSDSVNFTSVAYGEIAVSRLDKLDDEVEALDIRVDALEKEKGGGIEYAKTGNSLVIGIPFKDKKLGITIGQGGANSLVDFRNIFTFAASSGVTSPSDVSYIISSVGDMHAPFRFRDDGGTSSTDFTGGNHAYSSNTVKTAVLNYMKVYANGVLLDTNASGYCTNIRVEWQNDVKPGNAYAADDPYALRETHKMTFDGVRFEEWVDLEPLKNINLGLWYGFELVPLESQIGIQFPGGANRVVYDLSENEDSGDKVCPMVLADSAVALVSIQIDNAFDVGSRSLSDATTRGAFFNSTTGKSYFTVMQSSSYAINMAEGAHYRLHGYWQVLPK